MRSFRSVFANSGGITRTGLRVLNAPSLSTKANELVIPNEKAPRIAEGFDRFSDARCRRLCL